MLQNLRRMGSLILAAILTTFLASLPFILFFSSWVIPDYGITPVLLHHLPSLLVVGSLIGVGTFLLRGSLAHAIVGSAYSWQLGAVLSSIILSPLLYAPDILENRQALTNSALVLQVLLAPPLGLLPALIRLFRSRKGDITRI